MGIADSMRELKALAPELEAAGKSLEAATKLVDDYFDTVDKMLENANVRVKTWIRLTNSEWTHFGYSRDPDNPKRFTILFRDDDVTPPKIIRYRATSRELKFCMAQFLPTLVTEIIRVANDAVEMAKQAVGNNDLKLLLEQIRGMSTKRE